MQLPAAGTIPNQGVGVEASGLANKTINSVILG